MMKHLFCFFCFLWFFTIACSSTSTIEDKLLNCFYEEYAQKGIDVKKTIAEAKDLLIKHEVLKDDSGESFIELLNFLKQKGDLPNIDNDVLVKELNSITHLPNNVFCLNSDLILESNDFQESKLSEIPLIFERMEELGDISPSAIAGHFLEIFEAKDFEHSLYSSGATVMIVNYIIMFSNVDKGLTVLLPPYKVEEQIEGEPKPVFEILILPDRSILLNNKGITKEALFQQLETYIVKYKSEAVVQLGNYRETEYKFYIEIYDGVREIYDNVRNKVALEKYDRSYNDLDEGEQKIVRKIIPLKLSEVEPLSWEK